MKNDDKKLNTAPSQSAVEGLVMPGASYLIFFGEGNMNNKRIHVRSIVDEEYVVYRFWSRNKQRWIYKVDDKYYLEMLAADGKLKA